MDLYSLDIIQANQDDKYQNNLLGFLGKKIGWSQLFYLHSTTQIWGEDVLIQSRKCHLK
jgi:hypothetical protein